MKTIILIFYIALFSTILYPQEEVKRKDGRTIIIYEDGTWYYASQKSIGNQNLEISINDEMKAGIPINIYRQIENKIKNEYPNEYTMQKTIIELEVKNYKIVQNYSDTRIPSYILNQIKQKIIKEYPSEYTLQKTIIETEIKNYLELNK